MKNKVLALVLALCMVVAMLPMTVNAAQPQPAPKGGMVVPGAVGTMEPASVSPNASSYSVSLTSSGEGTAELLVDSPAKVGSEVYFLADPDNGYLAEVYVAGIDPEEVFYLGADMWGFFMPANKVELEVEFVAAEGDDHSIDVYENGGVGEYAQSRYDAQPGESVLLAVAPRDNDEFDPQGYVWVSGAPAYYLFEEDGVHYYEIIMGSENVKVFLCYNHAGPFSVTPWLDGDPNGGTVTVSHEKAYVNDLVTVTIKLNPGYQLVSANAVSYAGDLNFELTPIGNDQYTFRMHPAGVELHVRIEAVYNPVTVTVETGLGGTAFADLTEAKAGDTVTLTCTPEEGYRVAQITGVKDLTDNGDGTYTFTMPGKAVNIQVLFLREDNPFLDVNETNYFYDSVMWAVEENITSGMTHNTFGPFTHCTRAQVVTFLWRFAGSPEPELTEIPFEDVRAGEWYTDAVLWAVENNITNGVSAKEFGTDLPCTRSQVVTFLWRFLGEPVPELTEHSFTDVEPDGWYETAVLWAVENGITTGTTATTFSPDGKCERCQVVTFLYRTSQIPAEPDEPEVPDVPVKTYMLDLRTNGYGEVKYVDDFEAAPGESIFFYAIPNEGYYLSEVSIFNPNNEIDLTKIRLYEHEDNLYELVMIDHDIIMTCKFAPLG